MTWLPHSSFHNRLNVLCFILRKAWGKSKFDVPTNGELLTEMINEVIFERFLENIM